MTAADNAGNTALPENASPVLVAVDFSADSGAGLRWAAEHASLSKSPLVVLHVVHDPADDPGFYQDPQGDTGLQGMVDVAEKMMRDFCAASRQDIPDSEVLRAAETKIVSGLPAGRIVEVAKQIGAKHIVMGSRGLSGIPHIMLGSVAERVIQLSDIPVTIVKNTQAGGEEQ